MHGSDSECVTMSRCLARASSVIGRAPRSVTCLPESTVLVLAESLSLQPHAKPSLVAGCTLVSNTIMIKCSAIAAFLLVAVSALSAAGKPSLGYWGLYQEKKEYAVHLDEHVRHGGKISARLTSIVPEPHAFCNLTQMINAEKFKGARVRFSGDVRTSKVGKWAGVWMRVDGERASPALAFDNMEQRPIRGTSSWKRCSVVLDVPAEAVDIAFGMLMGGAGAAWVSDMKFEVVDSRVPVTGGWYARRKSAPSQEKNPFDKSKWGNVPRNLDFQSSDPVTPLFR